MAAAKGEQPEEAGAFKPLDVILFHGNRESRLLRETDKTQAWDTCKCEDTVLFPCLIVLLQEIPTFGVGKQNQQNANETFIKMLSLVKPFELLGSKQLCKYKQQLLFK